MRPFASRAVKSISLGIENAATGREAASREDLAATRRPTRGSSTVGVSTFSDTTRCQTMYSEWEIEEAAERYLRVQKPQMPFWRYLLLFVGERPTQVGRRKEGHGRMIRSGDGLRTSFGRRARAAGA